MLPYLLVALLIICFGLVVVRGAPYVPSHRRQLQRAFDELYDLGPQDRLVDLGSGDGVVLRTARRRGARAIGYELNPLLVVLSRLLSRGDRGITIHLADYTRATLPDDVTVVYAFTTSHSIETIGHLMEQWSATRSLYLISYGFELAHYRPLRQRGPMTLYRFGK